MIDEKNLIEDLAQKYAQCLVVYGVDIREKLETATSISRALDEAYLRGRRDSEKSTWIPTEEKIPYEGQKILYQTRDGYLRLGLFEKPGFIPLNFHQGLSTRGEVVAWMPIPKPYKPPEPEWKERMMQHFTKGE